uniref:Uncharacterized protein n=1 Tax=Romanomermis culicivorax TaxID=13658 RepID=A0A915I9C5_ROMCU
MNYTIIGDGSQASQGRRTGAVEQKVLHSASFKKLLSLPSHPENKNFEHIFLTGSKYQRVIFSLQVVPGAEGNLHVESTHKNIGKMHFSAIRYLHTLSTLMHFSKFTHFSDSKHFSGLWPDPTWYFRRLTRPDILWPDASLLPTGQSKISHWSCAHCSIFDKLAQSATCLYYTCCSPSMLGGVEKCSTTPSKLSQQIFCAGGLLAEQRGEIRPATSPISQSIASSTLAFNLSSFFNAEVAKIRQLWLFMASNSKFSRIWLICSAPGRSCLLANTKWAARNLSATKFLEQVAHCNLPVQKKHRAGFTN